VNAAERAGRARPPVALERLADALVAGCSVLIPLAFAFVVVADRDIPIPASCVY